MDPHYNPEMGSERQFGLLVGGIFTVIALFPLINGEPVRYWLLIPALALVIVAAARPNILRPLNRLWFRLGLLLGRIVTPVVMGLIFGVAIVPTGLVFRVLKKDPLHCHPDPAAKTYWIPRQDPVGPMNNQF